MVVQKVDKFPPCTLRNPKVHCHIHTTSPLDPILSQMTPLYILTTYYFRIRFNIILPPTSYVLSILFSNTFNQQHNLTLVSETRSACEFPQYFEQMEDDLSATEFTWR